MYVGVGLDLYIVEGPNPGFSYQVEAFDPEDTSQNIPLSVSLLVNLERGLTQEPSIWAGWAWAAVMGEICCRSIEGRGGGNRKGDSGQMPQIGLMALCDLGQVLNLSELQFLRLRKAPTSVGVP